MSTRSLHSLPKTRAEAIALGVTKYFTGKPCRNGHLSARYAAKSQQEGRCCDCTKAYQSKKYYANTAKAKAKSKAYSRQNPDANYKAHLKRAYGISLELYKDMLARQGGRCANCGSPDAKGDKSRPNRWHVDHCHDTGRVRGLLCRPCNLMLGNAGDDPQRLLAAIDYLNGRSGAYSLATAMLSFGS